MKKIVSSSFMFIAINCRAKDSLDRDGDLLAGSNIVESYELRLAKGLLGHCTNEGE